VRERLRDRTAIGVIWLALGSTTVIDLACAAGADLLVLDAQHGLWDRWGIENAIGLCRGQASVLVRVAENSAVQIGQALDAGAEGVIVPLVETAEQAALAVSHVRYPPGGTRSSGGIRPLSRNFADYVAETEHRVTLGVMIETAQGLANAEAILRTPGIDFLMIGTGDLALSLGNFPDVGRDHAEACARLLAECQSLDLPCGIFTTTLSDAQDRRSQGYDLVVIATDSDTITREFCGALRTFSHPAL
jgi:2-keto-3-deoxy-L-rhamnonate aldolase RhmA